MRILAIVELSRDETSRGSRNERKLPQITSSMTTIKTSTTVTIPNNHICIYNPSSPQLMNNSTSTTRPSQSLRRHQNKTQESPCRHTPPHRPISPNRQRRRLKIIAPIRQIARPINRREPRNTHAQRRRAGPRIQHIDRHTPIHVLERRSLERSPTGPNTHSTRSYSPAILRQGPEAFGHLISLARDLHEFLIRVPALGADPVDITRYVTPSNSIIIRLGPGQALPRSAIGIPSRRPATV